SYSARASLIVLLISIVPSSALKYRKKERRRRDFRSYVVPRRHDCKKHAVSSQQRHAARRGHGLMTTVTKGDLRRRRSTRISPRLSNSFRASHLLHRVMPSIINIPLDSGKGCPP